MFSVFSVLVNNNFVGGGGTRVSAVWVEKLSSGSGTGKVQRRGRI